MGFSKPNIIISKCINFANCRYNGDIINDDFLKKLSDFVNFIPVCPEVEIGLGTPRETLRIYNKKGEKALFQPGNNLDLTEKMRGFSNIFLSKQENIDGFILKNRSPSCGIGDVKVYDKKDGHSYKRNGVGIFSENIDNYFLNIPREDEGRLKNFRIRESFLTKIFCLSDFREVKKSNKLKDLADFQAKNKYLFMFYSPDLQVKLGRIIASYDKTNLDEIYKLYYEKLLELFSTETKIGKMINSLTHIFGYFKKSCSSSEKEYFLDILDNYKDGKLPNSSVVSILKTWALRDENEYILKQTILNPYPNELVELKDSGKFLEL